MKRSLWPAIIVILVLGCRQGPKPPDPPPAPQVTGQTIAFETSAPQLAHLEIEAAQPRQASAFPIYGRLTWDDDVTVRVFSPVGGRVLGLEADIGQAVAADAVLARLASPDYGQVQADVQRATADLALSETTFERTRDLFEHGAAPRKDLESAVADDEKAVSELERAQAQLAALSRGPTDAVDGVYLLRSPLPGLIVERNLTPGQLVRPDLMLANLPQYTSPLFVVTDPTRLWLFLDVTELDANVLRVGQKVRVHTPAYPERTFEGRLDLIGSSLDPATRTLKVRALVDNSEQLLKAEMYVTADVVGDSETGVDVSAKAVFLRDNQYYVFVEEEPGRFERRPVTLGPEDSGMIAVVGGIVPGQRVVTEGSLLLQAILEGGGDS